MMVSRVSDETLDLAQGEITQASAEDALRTAADETDGENCPVIHADKVFLGFSFNRQLRVVCFENPGAVA